MDAEDAPVYQAIVRELARTATEQVAQKAIDALKSLSATLSGPDSGLENVWEEICVQVQDEHSFDWSAYQQTVDDTIFGLVLRLSAAERAAIWISSEACIDWLVERDEPEGGRLTIKEIPALPEHVASEVAHTLYRAAADDSSPAVERYLARSDCDDDLDDWDDPDDADEDTAPGDRG